MTTKRNTLSNNGADGQYIGWVRRWLVKEEGEGRRQS